MHPYGSAARAEQSWRGSAAIYLTIGLTDYVAVYLLLREGIC